MQFIKKTILILALIFVFTGCQTNPISGRSQFMLISEDSAIAVSREAYVNMLKPISDDGKLDSDVRSTKRVKRITELLVAQAIKYRPETAEWRWSVHVVDDPEVVNAWCMAGGRMAIYTGLINGLEATDDEIAQVMGHEIAHALLAHSAEKISRGVAMQAGLSVIAVSQSDNKYSKYTVQGAALAAIIALELPNSRNAETEADRIGIAIAAKAGFDPQAAITLWEKMDKNLGDKKRPPVFLSTHPAPQDRISVLRAIIPTVQPFFENQDPRPVFKLKDDSLTKDEIVF